MNFSDAELDRYARHLVLHEVGGAGQAALKAARVVVIGAGGIGSPVLQYLAAGGVGTLVVIDDDRVDASNLQRQTLFGDGDIGRAKVAAAADALARINPFGLVMDDKSPDEVASELQEMHDNGKGVLGMKILGEGRVKEPEKKDESLRFVLGLGTVDAFVIGFESTDQVDDLLERTEKALAALRKG